MYIVWRRVLDACILYVVYCTGCTLYSIQCTVYTLYIIQYSCILYNVQSSYIDGFLYVLYTVQCALYNVHCILYIVHCTVYIIQCTLCTVKYVYIVRRIYRRYLQFISCDVLRRNSYSGKICRPR